MDTVSRGFGRRNCEFEGEQSEQVQIPTVCGEAEWRYRREWPLERGSISDSEHSLVHLVSLQNGSLLIDGGGDGQGTRLALLSVVSLSSGFIYQMLWMTSVRGDKLNDFSYTFAVDMILSLVSPFPVSLF